MTAISPQSNSMPEEYQCGTVEINLPIVNLQQHDADLVLQKLAEAASTTGVALITSLSLKPPIAAIQRLFEKLDTNPSLVTRIKATCPGRGRKRHSNNDPVQILDLSVARLQKISETDPKLVEELGVAFAQIWHFYAMVETTILPLLTKATSQVAGVDLDSVHSKRNNNLRLIKDLSNGILLGPYLGELMHPGTYGVVFQDGEAEGLEYEVDGEWVPVPADVDAVVSWGWSSGVLSKGRIKTARHRVVSFSDEEEIRTTAVVSVAPDLSAMWMPVKAVRSGQCLDPKPKARINASEFEEVALNKRRQREWSEEGERTKIRRI